MFVYIYLLYFISEKKKKKTICYKLKQHFCRCGSIYEYKGEFFLYVHY